MTMTFMERQRVVSTRLNSSAIATSRCFSVIEIPVRDTSAIMLVIDPAVNAADTLSGCLPIGNEGSFKTLYLLSRQTGWGGVYTDGKMLPPPLARPLRVWQARARAS